jgi:hypothetical protein
VALRSRSVILVSGLKIQLADENRRETAFCPKTIVDGSNRNQRIT